MAKKKTNEMWKTPAGKVSIGLVLLAVIVYNVFFPEQEPEPSRSGLIPVELVKTIDGDTIKIKYRGSKEKVRLLMIDAPEMHHPTDGEQPFAREAKLLTKELLNNAEKIEIEFDKGPKRDKYDRLLAYVFADDVLVQEELLKKGYAAIRYIYEPNNALENEFKEYEKIAINKKSGIWSAKDYFQRDGFHPEVLK